MSDLIDTTEMYLKTVFEMEEDNVAPLRARIVDRLGHSGPTVSQTVARMERDGLLVVRRDRQIELSEKGREIATEVIRKHRLAERLLVDIIGLDWKLAHEEACRWEHVMSERVEQQLGKLLENTDFDPYGNPVPGSGAKAPQAQCVLDCDLEKAGSFTLVRLGEPVQAAEGLLSQFADAKITVGSVVSITNKGNDIFVGNPENGAKVRISEDLARHLFVTFS